MAAAAAMLLSAASYVFITKEVMYESWIYIIANTSYSAFYEHRESKLRNFLDAAQDI